MISVIAIRDAFNNEQCDSLTNAFKILSANQAMRYISMGLHPKRVPRKFYTNVINFEPTKLYLFKPQHVVFSDLLPILEYQKELKKYSSHIEYYKREILQTCSLRTLSKCIKFMIISDDDIRYLLDRFSESETMSLISSITPISVGHISYLFNEEMTEDIILRDREMAYALYEHQNYEPNFLRHMLYTHGIIPTNEGIKETLTIDEVIKILSISQKATDSIDILDMLPEDLLKNEDLQSFILDSIINCKKIEHYVAYAREFLAHRREDLGLLAGIFFDEEVNWSDYSDDVSREQLEIVCRYIDRYGSIIEEISNYLIKNNYFDLMASIIDEVPLDVLTEEICIRIVCESPTHVSVRSLPVRSPLVIRMCIQMKYEDVVDFLDDVDLHFLLSKNAELITDYILRTNWLNHNYELISLYVKKYGFCPKRMSKLMFDYPLSSGATDHLLRLMVENSGAVMFFPNTACSLSYLVCTTNKLRRKKISPSTVSILSKKSVNSYEKIIFESIHSPEFKTFIQLYTIQGLKTCGIGELSKTEYSGNGICVQYKRNNSINLSEESRLCMQLMDICRLTLHGLFFVPSRYFSGWFPIIDALNGNEIRKPTKIDVDYIPKLSPGEFITYDDLGTYSTREYGLEEQVSNYHAAINSVFSTLILYLVVGSVRHVEEDKIFVYVNMIVESFFKGMKINEVLFDSPIRICNELISLRSTLKSSVGSLRIKEGTLDDTISLCTNACIALILDNNQSSKSTL